jgi:hypothetical protein
MARRQTRSLSPVGVPESADLAAPRTPARRLVILVFAAFLASTGAGPVSSAVSDCDGGATLAPDAPAGHAVVIELFTSQGCSTCPPADRLLSKLGEESGLAVVPLAFHVDIWNRIGWNDPFSSKDWTQRQVGYARRFGLQQLSTPQAVVDGGADLVGSDEPGVRAAIATAAARPAGDIAIRFEPAASKVKVDADVDLPASLRGRKLDLMLALYETGLVTAVGRGENEGRTLRDDYVVRRLVRAARLSGSEFGRTHYDTSVSLEKGWDRSHLGIAAFLQDPASLAICGASARALVTGEEKKKMGAR